MLKKKVVKDTVKEIEDCFGEMTVTRGKEHTYVGLDVTLKDKHIEVRNTDYVTETFELFGEDIAPAAKNSAKSHLFEVEPDRKPLPKQQHKIFHNCVAKLLYVAKRGRPDILTAISFLTTRVLKPTVDDWGKLKRALQYLKGTIDMFLTLGVDSTSILKTWVDASYAPHPDMRSHTGECSSFGIGMAFSRSAKQKLNTKSSTEAELIRISDVLPYHLWIKYCLEELGHRIKENIIYQDNQSAIRMEINGRRSVGPQSRHINIRYFGVKDSAKRESIDIEYCPTFQMVTDFFTKPLQGELFREFRDVIMGVVHVSKLNEMLGLQRKERVDINESKELRDDQPNNDD